MGQTALWNNHPAMIVCMKYLVEIYRKQDQHPKADEMERWLKAVDPGLYWWEKTWLVVSLAPYFAGITETFREIVTR
jgi:hypothetical protein